MFWNTLVLSTLCPFVPADVRRVVSDSALLFPDPPGGLAEYQGIKDADRTENVRLVVK